MHRAVCWSRTAHSDLSKAQIPLPRRPAGTPPLAVEARVVLEVHPRFPHRIVRFVISATLDTVVHRYAVNEALRIHDRRGISRWPRRRCDTARAAVPRNSRRDERISGGHKQRGSQEQMHAPAPAYLRSANTKAGENTQPLRVHSCVRPVVVVYLLLATSLSEVAKRINKRSALKKGGSARKKEYNNQTAGGGNITSA